MIRICADRGGARTAYLPAWFPGGGRGGKSAKGSWLAGWLAGGRELGGWWQSTFGNKEGDCRERLILDGVSSRDPGRTVGKSMAMAMAGLGAMVEAGGQVRERGSKGMIDREGSR